MTEPQARARATDPHTSHEAARHMNQSGGRSTQAEAVMGAVQRWPGRTAKEIAKAIDMDRYAVSRRLPELEEEGMVRKGPARKCAVGGRSSVTWEPCRAGQGALF